MSSAVRTELKQIRFHDLRHTCASVPAGQAGDDCPAHEIRSIRSQQRHRRRDFLGPNSPA